MRSDGARAAPCRSLHPGGPVPAVRAGLRILFRQTGDSPGRSVCAPVISPAGNRSHGLRDRVWPTGRGTVCQLFFLATAALRTVANAVHAISGTASAAAV